jgi:hypothetical protein
MSHVMHLGLAAAAFGPLLLLPGDFPYVKYIEQAAAPYVAML